MLPWTAVELDDVQFCQMSYRTRQSLNTVVDEFEALFLKWHGSDPQTFRSKNHVSLFGIHPEYNDYVEISNAEKHSVVSLSLMRPSDAEAPLTSSIKSFAGLPVVSQSRIGGMTIYHLATPYGMTAARSQVLAYLKQEGWEHQPTFTADAMLMRGESLAMVQAVDDSDALALTIMKDE